MDYNLLGFLVFSALAVLLVPAALRRRLPLGAQLLFWAAALRVIGSLARYEILFRFYGGQGDAVHYYQSGRELAPLYWNLDGSVWTLHHWFQRTHWWGTPFMEKLSGMAVACVGYSLRAEFLLFSFIAFAGILLIIAAFRSSLSEPATLRFASWCFLWPSLWFWPSSVGKEAVTMLAIGLATLGYAGRRRRVGWVLFAAGLALGVAIRPHVGVVLAASALAGQWLGSWKGVTRRRVFETLLFVVVFLLALRGMSLLLGEDSQFELEGTGADSISAFMNYWAQQTTTGGSNIGAVPVGLLGAPVAFANIWMRPFPWEAHNLTSLFSALEIVLLWWLIWKNRRPLLIALKNWRKNRLLCFAIPLIVCYTLMIGFTFGNLGIIARQRTPIFPFVLMIVTAVPVARPARAPAVAPQAVAQRSAA